MRSTPAVALLAAMLSGCATISPEAARIVTIQKHNNVDIHPLGPSIYDCVKNWREFDLYEM